MMKGKSAQHMSIIGMKNDWETPKEIYNDAIKKYNIRPKIDVCALDNNKVCKNYFGYDHIVRSNKDGLSNDWKKDFFMNPPYDPDYQCSNCGSINSFDWKLFSNRNTEKAEGQFLTDIQTKGIVLQNYEENETSKISKSLICKSCGVGRTHRITLHKGVSGWIEKAYQEHLKHNVNGLILTFAKTDTKWWHNFVEDKAEVHFIEGRIRFLDKGNVSGYPAPYGSCWIIYRAK